MKIIAIIPSRYESTRFRGKPLAYIKKKPMIQWVYERVNQSNIVDSVYVATNNEKILKVVRKFGGKAIMTSTRHISGSDRIAEAINNISLSNDDIIINVQGDQPLVNTRSLNDVVRPFFDYNINVKICTLAYKIKYKDFINDPKDVKVVIDHKGYAMYFSRSNIPYRRNISIDGYNYKHLGIYAYKKKFLKTYAKFNESKLEKIEGLEQLRIMEHGHKIYVITSSYDSPEVDIPLDIKKIEKKLNI